MTQSNSSVIVGNEVDPDVEKLWASVFQSSAIVIVHAKKFGFNGMSQLNPNIDDLLIYLKLVVGALDAVTDFDTGVTPEEVRLLMNAKKQLATLESVAKMLKLGDVNGFHESMRELESQAHH